MSHNRNVEIELLALSCELEGMKAANQHSVAVNGYPDYNENHFDSVAMRVRELFDTESKGGVE
tara:strand:- start:131 stop:319 length:189 start_codon:yes stop_codon:yes gene_type:complete